MDCSHAGCDEAVSMFNNTSDNFALYPNNSTYCVANYAFGFGKEDICNQVAPNAIKLLLGVSGFPSVINTKMAGGFSIGWHKSYECRIRVYDIHFIYYGTPPPLLLDRSVLSNNSPKNGPGDPRECAISDCLNATATVGDPIDTRTGNFDYSLVDLSLQTIAGSLTLQRSYASQTVDIDQFPMNLGPGWTHNHDTRLIFDNGIVWFKAHTLNQYQFTDNGDQTFTPYAGVLADLSYHSSTDTYSLQASDQSIYTFNSLGRLVSWRNELGYGFDYYYNAGELYRVVEPLSGRYIQFDYQDGRIASVNDHTGRFIYYGYDINGDLASFTDSRNRTWIYAYDGASHHLNSIKEPSSLNKTILSIHYDELGRADEQFTGKNERIVKITYNPDGTSAIVDALGRQTTDVYDGRNTNAAQENPAGYSIYKNYDHNFRPASITDQDNRTLTYQWSPDGANLTYVKDAAGYETFLQYNAENRLTSVTDPRNQVTTYTYDGALLTSAVRHTSTGDLVTSYTYTTAEDAPQPAGLLKTITDARGHTTSFTYYSDGQLQTITNADNQTTTFSYYDTGLTKDVADPLGRVIHYEYDPAGNLTRVIRNYDPAKSQNEENIYNLTDEFIYDDQGRLETKVDTLGNTTRYMYNDAGQLWKEIDPEQNTTTYEYHSDGNIKEIIDPLGHKTAYTYHQDTGWVKEVRNNLGQVVRSYTYNPDGSLHTETQPTPTGDFTITFEAYDDLRRPTRVSDNEGRWHEVSYDAYGNPLTRVDALGRVTQYEYNDLGLLEVVVENFKEIPDPGDDPNATNVRTEYTYDELGNLKTITDANDHITTYSYDPLNRLSLIKDHLSQVISYQYNTPENKVSVTDQNGFTVDYYYDLADRLDIIDYPGEMPDVNFDYNPLGRMTDMFDGLGQTHWAYDNLNRIVSITDPFARTVGYGYDPDGKRASITYPAPLNKTVTYQYNALDQLETVMDGAAPLAQYAYDSAGRLSSVSRPNGVVTTYGYSLSGLLESLTHQSSFAQLASYQYHYDPVGNIDWVEEQVIHPHFTFLPLIINEGEEGLGELYQLPIEDGMLFEEHLSEGYPAPLEEGPDALKREDPESIPPDSGYPAPDSASDAPETSFLQQLRDFLAGLFGPEIRPVSAKSSLFSDYPPPGIQEIENPLFEIQTIDYSYDALNRLTGAVYSDGRAYSYTYDRVGNRASQTVDGIETVFQYDAINRLTNAGGVAFTWDNNGNLLNDGLNTYSYDLANRLIGISGPQSAISFAYDGLGNRYQQIVDGKPQTYALDLAGGLSQVLYDEEFSYIYGLERLAQQAHTGEYETFLPDRLGSVRQVAGASGFPSFAQEFDPYGSLSGYAGRGSSHYGFAGEWIDSAGLQYLRARYYSPAQGRFISRDPFPGMIDQPASLNPYSYALNNPVVYTDPSGEFIPILAIAGIGFVAGAMYDAYMQTNGFTNLCHYDLLETLAWGMGGAAAVTTATILAVSGVGFLGMGLQGVALGLTSIGISASVSTSLFIAGSSYVGWSSAVLVWLFSSTSYLDNIKLTLSTAASRAQQTVVPGNGPVYGTRVHTAFAKEVRVLGKSNLNSEVSYLAGQRVPYGTPGSARIDVVYGPVDNPIATFDLKTGSATLMTGRIQQIQSNLPRPNIPVFEIRP